MRRKSFLVPIITEWQRYTPTISAGYGVATSISFFFRRVGDSLHVLGSFTAGTVAASLGSISIPAGLTISTTKITLANTTAASGQQVGIWTNAGNGGNGFVVTALGTSTTLVYTGGYFTEAVIQIVPDNVSGNISNDTLMGINFTVPIAGWTANRRIA